MGDYSDVNKRLDIDDMSMLSEHKITQYTLQDGTTIMTKDKRISAAFGMLEAMGLTVSDLTESQSELESSVDNILPVVNELWSPAISDKYYSIYGRSHI